MNARKGPALEADYIGYDEYGLPCAYNGEGEFVCALTDAEAETYLLSREPAPRAPRGKRKPGAHRVEALHKKIIRLPGREEIQARDLIRLTDSDYTDPRINHRIVRKKIEEEDGGNEAPTGAPVFFVVRYPSGIPRVVSSYVPEDFGDDNPTEAISVDLEWSDRPQYGVHNVSLKEINSGDYLARFGAPAISSKAEINRYANIVKAQINLRPVTRTPAFTGWSIGRDSRPRFVLGDLKSLVVIDETGAPVIEGRAAPMTPSADDAAFLVNSWMEWSPDGRGVACLAYTARGLFSSLAPIGTTMVLTGPTGASKTTPARFALGLIGTVSDRQPPTSSFTASAVAAKAKIGHRNDLPNLLDDFHKRAAESGLARTLDTLDDFLRAVADGDGWLDRALRTGKLRRSVYLRGGYFVTGEMLEGLLASAERRMAWLDFPEDINSDELYAQWGALQRIWEGIGFAVIEKALPAYATPGGADRLADAIRALDRGAVECVFAELAALRPDAPHKFVRSMALNWGPLMSGAVLADRAAGATDGDGPMAEELRQHIVALALRQLDRLAGERVSAEIDAEWYGAARRWAFDHGRAYLRRHDGELLGKEGADYGYRSKLDRGGEVYEPSSNRMLGWLAPDGETLWLRPDQFLAVCGEYAGTPQGKATFKLKAQTFPAELHRVGFIGPKGADGQYRRESRIAGKRERYLVVPPHKDDEPSRDSRDSRGSTEIPSVSAGAAPVGAVPASVPASFQAGTEAGTGRRPESGRNPSPSVSVPAVPAVPAPNDPPIDATGELFDIGQRLGWPRIAGLGTGAWSAIPASEEGWREFAAAAPQRLGIAIERARAILARDVTATAGPLAVPPVASPEPQQEEQPQSPAPGLALEPSSTREPKYWPERLAALDRNALLIGERDGSITRVELPASAAPGASMGAVVELQITQGATQLLVHPAWWKATKLPTRLKGGASERDGVAHKWADPISLPAGWGMRKAGQLKPWMRFYREGASGTIAVAIPQLEDRASWKEARSAEILLRAALYLKTECGVSYKSGPGSFFQDIVERSRKRGAFDASIAAKDFPAPYRGSPDIAPAHASERPLLPEERRHKHVYRFDNNSNFLYVMNHLLLPVGVPEIVAAPAFDARRGGCWKALITGDPSHAGLLPHPCHRTGERFTPAAGFAWYTTTQLASAERHGCHLEIKEAWLYPEARKMLQQTYTVFRNAIRKFEILADGGDEAAALALKIVKDARTRGLGWFNMDRDRDDEEPIDLHRPDWYAEIRAAGWGHILRQLHTVADKSGRAPFAAAVDAVYFTSDNPDPIAFAAEIGLPLGRRLGVFKPDGVAPLTGVLPILDRPGNHLIDLSRAMRTPGRPAGIKAALIRADEEAEAKAKAATRRRGATL